MNSLNVSGVSAPQPSGAHNKYGHGDWLEYGALLVFRPSPKAAPYRHENSGKPSNSSKDAIEETDACVS